MTAALAADLTDLSRALDEPGADIAATLRRLAVDARSAVPSYAGLTVVAGDPAAPVTFTAAEGSAGLGRVRSSLAVPLPIADGVPVRVVLYAATPGAFVDLAADLAWLTGLAAEDFALDHDVGGPEGADLAQSPGSASAVNQAIGVLIGRGHTLEQAATELDALAACAGHSRSEAAQVVLGDAPLSD